MNDLQWYDYMRLVVSAMAMYTLIRILVRYKLRGETWSGRLMDIAWVIFGFLFLVIWGSIEQVVLNVAFGPRIFLTFMVVLLSMRALRSSDEPLQKF